MFSDNSIKRIFKKAGALKVSKEALKKFKQKIEEDSLILAKKSKKNALYSGRKVVRKEDVKNVLEQMKEEEFEI